MNTAGPGLTTRAGYLDEAEGGYEDDNEEESEPEGSCAGTGDRR